MARRFAEGTDVPIERSRLELERVLKNAGASKQGMFRDGDHAAVVFELRSRMVKLSIDLPSREVLEAAYEADGRGKGDDRDYWVELKLNEEEKRLWRVLVLVVKAKLEAVSIGLSTVEREFLADVVVKGGKTVGEILATELAQIYGGKNPPKLLLGPAS